MIQRNSLAGSYRTRWLRVRGDSGYEKKPIDSSRFGHVFCVFRTNMKIIELNHESVTLEDVIELARQDPVSILTARGEEVYVTLPAKSTISKASGVMAR